MFDFLELGRQTGFTSHSKTAAVNRRRRAARRTTLLRLEQLEARNLLAAAPADLVSWYRAEGDASDFAGGNDGTLLNGATFTAGKVGQAFLFDGADDHVSVPDSADQNPGSQFTVEAWVNPSSSGHGRPIAQKRSPGNVGGYTFETTDPPFAPNNGLQFFAWIGGAQYFAMTPAGVLTNNTWQHVAATYDGTALRIFVDGVEKASTPASGAIDVSTEPVVIGQNVVIPSFAWHGAIDEVSFYSRALTATELQTIVAAGGTVVFRADFDATDPQVPPQFSGVTNLSGVQGYSAYGFSGDLLRNDSQPAERTVLTLTDLPPHETIDLRFLLAVIDSWDGDQKPGQFFAPDVFNVAVDGNLIFSETFVNSISTGNVQSYVPPPGVELARRQQLGFNLDSLDHLDSAYNLSLDPTFQNISHTASTLTVEWFAGGSGWEGGTNESWGIDNVEVVVRGLGASEPPPTADVEVTVTDSPDPLFIGEALTYAITVTNHGPDDATGVVVTDVGSPGGVFGSATLPVGDLASGASRSFQIVIYPGAAGTITNTASVTANEDDPVDSNNSFVANTLVQRVPPPTFELAQAQYEVREGEPFAVLTVRRTGGLDSSASVEFVTVDSTAGQRGIRDGLSRIDDFTTTSGTLFFRARSNVATIRVPIQDDSALEPDESFRVVLSNPSLGTELGAITSAEVIIHDNDPTVSFFAGSSERNESVTSRGSIEVRLHPASNQSVTVTYAATGGNATPGTDFTLLGRSLTFNPGETRKFINFSNINDTLFEGNETAIIELSPPTNAFLGSQSRHRVTIVDNDPQPPPVEPGSTPDTALFIDLQTLPRQSYREILVGNIDKDTYRVHLGAGERLALDVDPQPIGDGQIVIIPGLATSTLVVLGPDKVTELARVGRSAEPDTGALTDNAATLFQATTAGDYYIRLEKATTSIGSYRLWFHRLGVSENVPAPELLNAVGAMYAWFDGVQTVGITGPTGYGFTLEGPWQRKMTSPARSTLKSQTLTMLPGSQFTLKSPQGVALPLLANGPIVIATKAHRWGDFFGEVTTTAINFPVGLSIAPINDLLADTFGSGIAVGLLTGNWRISLGGKVLAVSTDRGLTNVNSPIPQLLDGVPYLRQKGPINVTAQLGPISISYPVIEKPVDWAFDPGDPMLYLKAEELGASKQPSLAVSLHGLLEYKPLDAPAPEVDAGVTEFFGHVYGSATFPFKIGPIPFEVDAELLISVDADRDGRPLGDLRDVDELFDVLDGDFSEVQEILNDVQIGANGKLNLAVIEDEFEVELGRASVVLNGLEETIWVRGQQGGVNPFAGTPLEGFSPGTQTVVVEGMINWDGDFLLSTTTTYKVDQINFEYNITISDEGISARVTGKAEFSVTIDLGNLGSASGKATVEIEANIDIEFDENGVPHFSGSVTSSGKLKRGGTILFSGSIESLVRDKGFRFRFPKGVGNIDLDLF